jgi:hypothetical protein
METNNYSQSTPDEPVHVEGSPDQSGESQGGIDPELTVIQRESGVDLFDSDPEISSIDRSHGKLGFYKSVEQACQKKLERQASENQPDSPASPSSRVPGQGRTSSPSKSGRDYLEESHRNRRSST